MPSPSLIWSTSLSNWLRRCSWSMIALSQPVTEPIRQSRFGLLGTHRPSNDGSHRWWPLIYLQERFREIQWLGTEVGPNIFRLDRERFNPTIGTFHKSSTGCACMSLTPTETILGKVAPFVLAASPRIGVSTCSCASSATCVVTTPCLRELAVYRIHSSHSFTKGNSHWLATEIYQRSRLDN